MRVHQSKCPPAQKILGVHDKKEQEKTIEEPEGICFGAPASQIPTSVDDVEYVFCNYLHAMGGVHKEGWLGDIFMKLSFR